MASDKHSASKDVALLDQPVQQSRDFIRHFWNGDTAWCRAVLAKEALGIPLYGTEPLLGPDGFCAMHERIVHSLPRIVLTDEEYHVTTLDDTLFCVIGIYTAFLGTTKDAMEKFAFRASLIWRNQPSSLLLEHYHLSALPLRENAIVPFEESSGLPDDQVRTIIQKMRANDTRNLVLRDEAGTTHFLNDSEVRYLEADGRKTLVHHRSGTICVCRGIGDLKEEVGSLFVPLHRSYVVNALFVESLSYKGCVLDDGTVLPVPSRRLAKIKEAVACALS